MSRLRLTAAALAGVIACGCTATPLPEPPAETLDFGRIHGPEVSPTTTTIGIIGEPGAGPPGHVLRVTNLDRTDAPVDATIAEDGSFELALPGQQGDELRFHTRLGRDRALPVDVSWGSASILPAARIECVALEPLQQQDFGFAATSVPAVSQTLVLRNECPTSVEVTAVDFRRPSADFALGTPAVVLPLGIAPDDEAGWSIEFAPTGVGDAEEILFIHLTVAEAQARYPITLYGDGE